MVQLAKVRPVDDFSSRGKDVSKTKKRTSERLTHTCAEASLCRPDVRHGRVGGRLLAV